MILLLGDRLYKFLYITWVIGLSGKFSVESVLFVKNKIK
jgi:hypothetical protein